MPTATSHGGSSTQISSEAAEIAPATSPPTHGVAPLASFPRFRELPAEIRSMIWESCLSDDIPELAVLQLSANLKKNWAPKVTTGYPVIAHVCHDGRQNAFRCVRTYWHRGDSIGAACRHLRPELDALLIGSYAFHAFFNNPHFFYGDFVARIEHLAVDASDVAPGQSPLHFARAFCLFRSLRTLSVVFAEGRGLHGAGRVLQLGYPVGRCRLRAFTPAELEATTIGEPCSSRYHRPGSVPIPIAHFLDLLHSGLEAATGNAVAHLVGDERVAAWDYGRQRLKLKLRAQVFEEYHRDEDFPRRAGPGWIAIGRRKARDDLVPYRMRS